MTKNDETWETTVVEDRDDLDFRGAQNVKRYFIDGVNGNDSNSGTSVNAAWKTMSNFISRINAGEADARCYIIKSGEYAISGYDVFVNVVMHVTARNPNTGTYVDNVTLKFTTTNISNNEASIAFYNSHINLEGSPSSPIKILVTSNLSHSGSRVHGDNCHVTLNKVYYIDRQTWYGSTIKYMNCTVEQCVFEQCNVYYVGTNLVKAAPENESANSYSLKFGESQVHFAGTVKSTLRAVSLDTNRFMYSEASFLSFDALVPSNASSLAYEKFLIVARKSVMVGPGVNSANRNVLGTKLSCAGGTLVVGASARYLD